MGAENIPVSLQQEFCFGIPQVVRSCMMKLIDEQYILMCKRAWKIVNLDHFIFSCAGARLM